MSRTGGHQRRHRLAPGTPESRRLHLALLAIGIATFAQLCSPQGLLPLIAQEQQVSPDSAALMISAATLGLACGVIPWSYIGDAVGRRPAMLAAIGLACGCAVLALIMPTFATTLALRFLEGAMLGGVPALAVAYLSEEVRPDAAAVAAGTYISGTTLGGLSGRLIAAPVGEQFGWRAGMLVVTALAVLCVFVFLLTAPRARNFVPRRTSVAEAVGQLLGNLRSPTLWILYLQAFLTMGGFVAMYNFLGFHLPLRRTNPAVAHRADLPRLSRRHGVVPARRGAGVRLAQPVLLGGNLIMMAGVALTLRATSGDHRRHGGLTAGFFAARWPPAGRSAAVAGVQSTSLYSLGYYAGPHCSATRRTFWRWPGGGPEWCWPSPQWRRFSW